MSSGYQVVKMKEGTRVVEQSTVDY